jgi:hypothetical protein
LGPTPARIIEEEVGCDDAGWSWPQRRGNIFATNDVATMEAGMPGGVRSAAEIPNGVGGSMARFTLTADYLYVVTTTDLQAYHLRNLADPVQTSTQQIGWGDIETIFPMQGNLFIGSMNGMYIYELSDPAQPGFASEFQHMRSCDPVVVEDDIAYVTLRGGTPCGSTTNQLDVIDVSNIYQPRLLATYPMTHPHGLGIRDGILFICDGDDGLKVYDASDVAQIDRHQLAHFEGIQAFDVIPLYEVLLLIGEDGFYQYDYSDPTDIQLLSSIPVANP